MVATARATAALVFLHGSGDTGAGIQQYLNFAWSGQFVSKLQAAGVQLLFPTAKPRPYRLAGGQLSSVWFDRYDFAPTSEEHAESVAESVAQVSQLLDSLVASGIPEERIFVGGFSMGGGLALQLIGRTQYRIGGIFALSSYLNVGSAVYQKLAASNVHRPGVFMRHGVADTFIWPEWGQSTAKQLNGFGVPVQFASIPWLAHSLDDSEVEELCDWVLRKLSTDSAAGASQNDKRCDS